MLVCMQPLIPDVQWWLQKKLFAHDSMLVSYSHTCADRFMTSPSCGDPVSVVCCEGILVADGIFRLGAFWGSFK